MLKVSNYNKTLAYSLAEAKDLYRPNLLINGDFQVNQRQQTTYNGDNSKYTYTVDMWRIVTTNVSVTCALTKNEDGSITFSSNGTGNASFEQVIDLPVSDYTAVIEVSNLNGSGIFGIAPPDTAWFQNNLQNGITIVKGNSIKPNRVVVRLNNTSSVTIKYIDLFEGSIAYPHVKENYAIALSRCYRYLYVIPQLNLVRYWYSLNSSYYVGFLFPMKMASIPNISGTYQGTNVGTISLTFEYDTVGVHYSSTQQDANGVDMKNVVISCEPK